MVKLDADELDLGEILLRNNQRPTWRRSMAAQALSQAFRHCISWEVSVLLCRYIHCDMKARLRQASSVVKISSDLESSRSKLVGTVARRCQWSHTRAFQSCSLSKILKRFCSPYHHILPVRCLRSS